MLEELDELARRVCEELDDFGQSRFGGIVLQWYTQSKYPLVALCHRLCMVWDMYLGKLANRAWQRRG
jgi:hypothetical protein